MGICGDSVRETQPLFQVENGGAIPTSPLQFEIIEIKRDIFIDLNKKWHSRLPICTNCWDGICFGAEFSGRLFAVAWWSKPIAQNRLRNGRFIYELRRMAICDEAPKNTASRFLKIMVLIIKKRLPDIYKLISYQDTKVHSGTIYRSSNWIMMETQSKGFQTWKNRKNRNDLSDSKKIRWEYIIKNNFNNDENINKRANPNKFQQLTLFNN